MAGPTNNWKSMAAILKEIYAGESWAYKEWKAGRLTDLEIIMYDKDLKKAGYGPFDDLVFKENPLLKMVKKS